MAFLERRAAGGRLLLRDDLPYGEVEPLLAGLSGELEGRGLEVLKRDRKASVLRGPAVAGTRTCLKLYPSVRRARRGFTNQIAVAERGVAVPEVLFLFERPRRAGGGALLAMVDLAPAPELDRWLARQVDLGRGAGPTVRRAARELGGALRAIHGRGVHLDDLKTRNVFILSEEPPRFAFVDLDGARGGRPPSLRLRARALGQLDRSTPRGVGLRARRAFFAAYREGLGPRAARRLRRLAIAFARRRPILYVSDAGVREEPWPRTAREWPR